MLANKRRPRQDEDPPPQAQRIFGSRFAILGDYDVDHKADQEAAEHGDDKVAENPQKNPPSAHQQEKQKLEAGIITDSSGQPWTTVRWPRVTKPRPEPQQSRVAKRRPKPRVKRDRLCPPPNVGRFVPIRTTPHSATATGKRKAGSSSRPRTANSNESLIAKGIANRKMVSSSADKGSATSKTMAQPASLTPTAKAIAEFGSKPGMARTYSGVASASLDLAGVRARVRV